MSANENEQRRRKLRRIAASAIVIYVMLFALAVRTLPELPINPFLWWPK